MSLLDELGLDPDNFTWEQLALCANMEVQWFYDTYETDEVHARNMDQACYHCPVLRPCAEAAMDQKEEGLWGGIYWSNGKVDKVRNKNKTEEEWEWLEKQVGRKLPR